ncbi:Rhomboid family [Geosmithia morbida]|uniref:Rhomboid-type serine protease n=1 Tax=Geosmithia morbida TaxID=1094350 RepID=A0A9P4YME7_9HYPO|nr:Rhomboid family [Geosmithia morbida]KAF4119646.1 Rhomboid family [Geosmithia morbida]
MASYDYYGSGHSQPAGNSNSNIINPTPQYASQLDPRQQSTAPTPAPSYHSQTTYPPAVASGHHSPTYPQELPARNPGVASPFDSVFDDNAYPANSNSNLQAYNSHGNSLRRDPSVSDMSQNGGGYSNHLDTGYYGAAGAASRQPSPVGSEAIPLQDRPLKDGGMGVADAEMNDHVYDAPEGTRRRRKKKKVGLGELGMLRSGKKGIPWVVYTFSLIQIGVFIGELVRNANLTGSPIMIKPEFNYMIGPSTQVLINMGGRYAPCMHNIDDIQGSTVEVLFLCPNATAWDDTCDLSTLCGFGGVPNPKFDGDAEQKPRPNQWYRFIIPIFLHAGIIHIVFNLLLQLTLAKEMEQVIGSIRFFLVYMSAGIFGFVMGGNFAAPAISSTGASGSLFGILALNLLDLLYSWKDRKSPVKDLLFIVIDMLISFVLGLLPGLDNFSHIGGFLMGLALGISVLHSPNSLRIKMGQDATYAAVPGGVDSGGGETQPFHKNPVGFFKGRKPLWWGWWLVRVGALILVIVIFIVLINRFYNVGSTCSWCKYLSCLPVKNWCELGTIQSTSS